MVNFKCQKLAGHIFTDSATRQRYIPLESVQPLIQTVL
jgi:hypothetical protein